jgi:hypothetical protein
MSAEATTVAKTVRGRFVRGDGRDILVLHRDALGRVANASRNSRAVFTLDRRAV